MTKIEDKATYLSRMRKTFVDKAWFMKMLPEDVTAIVDFGCADGSFMEYLREDFPEYKYIGIENNQKFAEESQQKGFATFESIDELVRSRKLMGETTVLVLNSVLHEVYSYADPEKFWKEVDRLSPKYIAIRDMHCTDYATFGSSTKKELACAFMEMGMQKEWLDFEHEWGKIDDGHTATHFLLKYFYTENWMREVKEDYLPFTFKDLHKALRKIGYDLKFQEFYGLPWLKAKWAKDLKLDRRADLRAFVERVLTHMKLFLEFGE